MASHLLSAHRVRPPWTLNYLLCLFQQCQEENCDEPAWHWAQPHGWSSVCFTGVWQQQSTDLLEWVLSWSQDWSTSPVTTRGESWGCSAWGREGSGETSENLPIPKRAGKGLFSRARFCRTKGLKLKEDRFRLDIRWNMDQVVQKSSIPGNVQDTVQMGLWAPWSCWRCPCPWLGVWTYKNPLSRSPPTQTILWLFFNLPFELFLAYLQNSLLLLTVQIIHTKINLQSLLHRCIFLQLILAFSC